MQHFVSSAHFNSLMSIHVLFGTSVGFYTATSSFGTRALMTLYIPRETVVEFTTFISNPPSWISYDVVASALNCLKLLR